MNLMFCLSAGADRLREFFAYIPGRLSSVSWRDILDIFCLSVILFFLFSFIRERRAGGYLLGIAVWSIIYGVSTILDLTAVRTLLGAIFSVGAVTLVIVFQPEIRDILGRFRSDSFRSLRSSLASEKNGKQLLHDESLDSICQAAAELARMKTGALIVFERGDQLGDVIRSGIEVDAKVSSYLLRNIFFDKSPLHDGAVVIRERRICAAGCLLQLSRRSDLDPSLGTRHRAAIGMSENSDAVIVVVSEETGIISVAYRRQITRNFTYSTLKAFLYKVMLNQTDGEPAETEERSHE